MNQIKINTHDYLRDKEWKAIAKYHQSGAPQDLDNLLQIKIQYYEKYT